MNLADSAGASLARIFSFSVSDRPLTCKGKKIMNKVVNERLGFDFDGSRESPPYASILQLIVPV